MRTIYENRLGEYAQVRDERRMRVATLQAEVDRLNLVLKYCDDEQVLIDLLKAENKLADYRKRWCV